MQRVLPPRPAGAIDRAIARLAAAQHGVVSHGQLVALGLSVEAIQWRLKIGRLHRLHKGVYLVGHPTPPPRAREMAAQLACEPRALISHRSAAQLWSLLPARGGIAVVDVTVVGRDARSRAGIRIHGVETLLRRDARRHGRLWLTAPARTILDLATDSSDDELENAIAQARRRDMLSDHDLDDQVARNPGRRGVARLRTLLTVEHGPSLTRSPPERRLLVALRKSDVPTPETNQRVCGFEVDLVWRRERLVVECDGRTYHSDPAAFELDRLRDAKLAARGYVVIRVTRRQLKAELAAVVDRIRHALALRRVA